LILVEDAAKVKFPALSLPRTQGQGRGSRKSKILGNDGLAPRVKGKSLEKTERNPFRTAKAESKSVG
jgi:hypothetical protein